jgi:hypothetical protein
MQDNYTPIHTSQLHQQVLAQAVPGGLVIVGHKESNK